MSTGRPGGDSAGRLGGYEDAARPTGSSRSRTRPNLAWPAMAARWKEQERLGCSPGQKLSLTQD